MFDIGAAELLVIIIVAVLVIGPSEMPRAMRTAGRWIGKVRKVSNHFRTGIDAMVREAELEDMEAKWKAQNEAIMKRSAATAEAEAGEPVMTGPPPKTAENAAGVKPEPVKSVKSVKDVADGAGPLPKSGAEQGPDTAADAEPKSSE